MNKKVLIAAALLLILVAVFLILKNRDSTEKLTRVFSADSTAIAKIEIIDPADTLIIVRQDKAWMLDYPVKWETNTATLEFLFANVINANYSKTVMTSSPDAIVRYNLEPKTALQVKTYDKKGKLRDHVYFGNNGNPYDYFRFEGSSDIYQMKMMVSNSIFASLDRWRSPVILRVPENEISSIESQDKDGSYVITRKDKDWYFKDAANDFKIPLENRALLRILNIMNMLDTYVFTDNPDSELLALFDTPFATVKVNLTNGKSRSLVFVKSGDKQYMLMLDNNPATLYSLVYDSVQRFTAKANLYLQLPYGSMPPGQ